MAQWYFAFTSVSFELLLDARLNFAEHTSYIKSKTFPKIKLLSRLSYILERDILLQLYKTLILPIFDFGDVLYHKLTPQDSDTLQCLQNTACHAILKADFRTHIVDLHDDLAMPTLYQRHCQHIENYMHKLLNGALTCSNILMKSM